MRLLAAWSLAPLVAAAGQANAPELPATTVTLYKVSQGPDECGQFTIDARLKEAAEKWLQMAEGHCGAHGYEEPTGSRSAVVPIIGGHVNVTLYKKADPLAGLKKAGKGALSQALARAMGLPTERLPVCCKTCEEGRSKYYEINDEKRLCSEVCMTPQAALVARFFAPSLVEAESGAVCASLGYEIYNETVAKGPGVQADVYAWGAKPAEADEARAGPQSTAPKAPSASRPPPRAGTPTLQWRPRASRRAAARTAASRRSRTPRCPGC